MVFNGCTAGLLTGIRRNRFSLFWFQKFLIPSIFVGNDFNFGVNYYKFIREQMGLLSRRRRKCGRGVGRLELGENRNRGFPPGIGF